MLPRPMKGRRVCCVPQNTRFGPLEHGGDQEAIIMTVDEFETIRLIDYMHMTQEECAAQMARAAPPCRGV